MPGCLSQNQQEAFRVRIPRTPAETVSVPCFLLLGCRNVPKNPRSFERGLGSTEAYGETSQGNSSGNRALAVLHSRSYFRTRNSERLLLEPVPLGRAWITESLLHGYPS
jgi:hypothetical protein